LNHSYFLLFLLPFGCDFKEVNQAFEFALMSEANEVSLS
jgi:hypothetical protein